MDAEPFLSLIQGIDAAMQARRPTTIHHSFKGEGRIVYANTPGEIYDGYDPSRERIATVQELMMLRVFSVAELNNLVPKLWPMAEEIARQRAIPDSFYDIIGETRKKMDAHLDLFGILQVRLTTSTHMVRADNEIGEDEVFFFNGNPFDTEKALAQAMQGELSDGGIAYDQSAVARVHAGTPAAARLPYPDYLQAKGGNFNGEEFLNHPIFSRACGDRDLMIRYTTVLQILSLLNYYHPGIHSGWRPGEMKQNYGRPIALGAVGEAFYPPNNSTVGHAALLLRSERR